MNTYIHTYIHKNTQYTRSVRPHTLVAEGLMHTHLSLAALTRQRLLLLPDRLSRPLALLLLCVRVCVCVCVNLCI